MKTETAEERDPVLTTAQIAQILGVVGKTVQNWVDAGHFGWVIPDSKHRRARMSEIVAFAAKHGMKLANPAGVASPDAVADQVGK